MKFNDAVIGVFFLVLSVLLLVHVQSFPKMPLSDYGPASFPRLLSIILGLCSIQLIVQGIRTRKTVPPVRFGEWVSLPERWRRLFLVPLTVIGYILLAKYLGFALYTFLALFLLLIDFHNGKWKFSLVTALVFTGAAYGIFVKILLIPLPVGFWSTIF